MVSQLQKLFVLALGGFAFQAVAADRPIQFPAYESALTVSGTLSQSLHSTHSPGLALGGESVYSRDHFNSGGGIKYFLEGNDDAIFNIYLGTGYKRFAQAQLGFGTEGALYRLRSELDLPWLWVLTKNVMHRDIRLPGQLDHYPNNRFVVTFSVEKYDSKRYLDNVSVGLGLRY